MPGDIQFLPVEDQVKKGQQVEKTIVAVTGISFQIGTQFLGAAVMDAGDKHEAAQGIRRDRGAVGRAEKQTPICTVDADQTVQARILRRVDCRVLRRGVQFVPHPRVDRHALRQSHAEHNTVALPVSDRQKTGGIKMPTEGWHIKCHKFSLLKLADLILI